MHPQNDGFPGKTEQICWSDRVTPSPNMIYSSRVLRKNTCEQKHPPSARSLPLGRVDASGADGGETGMSAVFESDASHGRNHAVFLARASSNGRAPSRYVAVQAGAPEHRHRSCCLLFLGWMPPGKSINFCPRALPSPSPSPSASVLPFSLRSSVHP